MQDEGKINQNAYCFLAQPIQSCAVIDEQDGSTHLSKVVEE